MKEDLKKKLLKEFVESLKLDRIYNYRWFMHYRRHHYKELSVADIREVYGQATKILGI